MMRSAGSRGRGRLATGLRGSGAERRLRSGRCVLPTRRHALCGNVATELCDFDSISIVEVLMSPVTAAHPSHARVSVDEQRATLLAFEPQGLDGLAHARIIGMNVVVEDHGRTWAQIGLPRPHLSDRVLSFVR